jgi:hypothetical protein
MDRATLAHLLRRAVTLPPHRVVARAAAIARQHALDLWQRRSDRAHATYSPPLRSVPWRNRVALDAIDIPASLHEPLRLLAESYRRHRFDLLGSGPIEVRYGLACRGFAGHKYPPHPGFAADRDGAWLAGEINTANLTAAQELWRRIDNAAYRPIDWQIDFRSGYRWRADAHFTQLSIPVDVGADVKVPWELGRLQHLPQLALCAILAAAGTAGFAPAADYVRELRCQLYDFLALNPPRFGVNWLCPMDVGIRAANMLMAVDLLVGAKLDPGQELIDIVIASARDHAVHIVDHLEWSETSRGNHYLANLVGLLWAAAYLPSDAWTDALLAFAAAELLHEGDRQFGDDGGNLEGSTNYHRLSAELVSFGVALLAGLSAPDLGRIDNARADVLRLPSPWRGPLRRHDCGGVTVAPPQLMEKLYRAAALMRSATRPDGQVIQIGDTDSGRLFKLTPTGRIEHEADGTSFREGTLDHRATASAVAALFGGGGGGGGDAATPDSIVARRLAGGRRFPQPAVTAVADHGELDAAVAAIASLPVACQRRRFVAFLEPIAVEAWQRAAFPSFGLYVFKTDRALIAFRCAPRPPPQAPLGHTHDDNLALEYVLGSASRIDPGTPCYTPSRALRDLYRSADAHDVVRAVDWDVAPPGAALFGLQHAAWAQCLAWQPTGVAGEIVARRGGGRLLRALRFTETGLEIWDGVDPPDCLRPVAPQIDVAAGYGKVVPFAPSSEAVETQAAAP